MHFDKSFATTPLFHNRIVRQDINHHPPPFPKTLAFKGVDQHISGPCLHANSYHYN